MRRENTADTHRVSTRPGSTGITPLRVNTRQGKLVPLSIVNGEILPEKRVHVTAMTITNPSSAIPADGINADRRGISNAWAKFKTILMRTLS
jgi:hypothetical protein